MKTIGYYCLLVILTVGVLNAQIIQSFTDPLCPDANNQFGWQFNMTNTGLHNNPGFTNDNGVEINMTTYNGWNDYVPGDRQKITNEALSVNQIAFGAGQSIAESVAVTKTGMGDTIGNVTTVIIDGAGINAGGDEGQKGRSLWVQQASTLAYITITATDTPAINTTITADITPGPESQVIPVVSSTGVIASEYVLIDGECSKVTAVTPTSISAKFLIPHINGAAVTGATRLHISAANRVGQGRLLVKLTQPEIDIGTAAASGGWAVGVGTNWNGLIPYQNAISFRADDSTLTSNQTLVDWYNISAITNANLLKFDHLTQSGGGYGGNAITQGGYSIRQSDIILHCDGGIVISRKDWLVGDKLEVAMSPNADITGETTYLQAFSTGCTARYGKTIVNVGPKPFDIGFGLQGAFNHGMQLSGLIDGLQIYSCGTQAIKLYPTPNTNGLWWGSPGTIGLDYTAGGLEIYGNPGAYVGHNPGVASAGKMQFTKAGLVYGGNLLLNGNSVVTSPSGSTVSLIGTGDNFSYVYQSNNTTTKTATPLISFGINRDPSGRGWSPAMGFFNSPAPVCKPTITGSLKDGTATASLIKALAQLNLVTDATTP